MSMASVASSYNTLPSVEEANAKFSNRDEIFSKLGPLLAKYNSQYGVCLVHRHCDLQEGEVMVATGNISKPEKDVQCYPEKWLATGEPYEFSKEPTVPPPEELFKEFQKIVENVGVLGLYFNRGEDIPVRVPIERTEGRQNITETHPGDDNDPIPDMIPTSWRSTPWGSIMNATGCVKPPNGVHYGVTRE
jgi:hypothetical protein